MKATMTFDEAMEQAAANGHGLGECEMASLGRGFAYTCKHCGERVYVARKTGTVGGHAQYRRCGRD